MAFDYNTGPEACLSPPYPGQERLEAAQIRLLYAQSGIGTMGAFLGAIALGCALWNTVSHERIVVWVLAYTALFLGRHCLIHLFQRQERDESNVIRWGKWHTLAISGGGLLWGAAGVWLFPQHSIPHQFLLATFIAGIAAAGSVIYAPTKDYASNLLLTLLPLSGRFIYEFSKFHVSIGGVILLFAVALLLTGRRMHAVYAHSLMLRYEKEDLVEELKDEIARRDRLESELKKAHDRLETRVEERTSELRRVNRTLEQEIQERRQVEEVLSKSEEKYRLLTEGATDVVWTLDLGTLRFIYISPSVEKTRGYSPAEAMELSLEKTLTSESYERAIAVLNEELARDHEAGFPSDRILLLEFTEICRDGSTIDTEARIKFLRDEKGIPVALLGITRDMTERKKAVEALKESEEKYRLFIETANEAIFVAQDGRLKFVNRRCMELSGYSEAELFSRQIFDLIHPDDRELVAVYDEQRLKGEGTPASYSIRIMDKHGNVKWLHIDSVLITWGDSPAALCFGSDMTGLRQAEEQLRGSEAQLSSALTMAQLGHWEYDVTKDLFTFNDHFYRMFRTTAEQVGGYVMSSAEYVRRFVHPDELPVVADEIRKAIETDDPCFSRQLEHRVVYANGEIGYINVRFSIVKDELGRTVKTYGVNQDITERKKAEDERENLRRQLAQAQKMEAIGTLTGGIAHDFNNLLTIVNGYTELMLSELTEADPLYADLQRIYETGQKGADLVRRLLALAQKSEANPQPRNLNDVVENVTNLMQRTFPKMIRLETVLCSDLGMVNADREQVEQIVMNLCINAKEAMLEGGRIKIETKNTLVDEEYSRLHPGTRPGRHVVIEISDTGAGMTKETMDRMFDPFFTTKGWDFKKGTGLGLSVAKGIVELHGGWITCRSEPGKGTTFRLYFPVMDDSPLAPDTPAAEGTAGGANKILLVDDEEYVRDLGKRILEQSGFAVITAENGEEAVKVYAGEKSSISLVVLDLIMPVMGGEKCLEELLKINPNVKVILSSGHTLDSSELVRLRAYTKGFVNKPYRIKQILGVVREILAGMDTFTVTLQESTVAEGKSEVD